jgi:hypothetical protein
MWHQLAWDTSRDVLLQALVDGMRLFQQQSPARSSVWQAKPHLLQRAQGDAQANNMRKMLATAGGAASQQPCACQQAGMCFRMPGTQMYEVLTALLEPCATTSMNSWIQRYLQPAVPYKPGVQQHMVYKQDMPKHMSQGYYIATWKAEHTAKLIWLNRHVKDVSTRHEPEHSACT